MRENMSKKIARVLLAGLFLLLVCAGCAESADKPELPEQPGQSGQPDNTPQGTTPTNSGTSDEGYAAFLPYDFEAVDIYGDDVNQQSLGEKRVYFIHYWATWCSPCVKEMPELAELAERYSDEVGFLGLVGDYSSNPDGAMALLQSSGVPDNFVMVDANLPGVAELLGLVSTGYLPSTAIVSAEGELVATIIGARGAEYVQKLEEFLRG